RGPGGTRICFSSPTPGPWPLAPRLPLDVKLLHVPTDARGVNGRQQVAELLFESDRFFLHDEVDFGQLLRIDALHFGELLLAHGGVRLGVYLMHKLIYARLPRA